jgi:hypothetical protein
MKATKCSVLGGCAGCLVTSAAAATAGVANGGITSTSGVEAVDDTSVTTVDCCCWLLGCQPQKLQTFITWARAEEAFCKKLHVFTAGLAIATSVGRVSRRLLGAGKNEVAGFV